MLRATFRTDLTDRLWRWTGHLHAAGLAGLCRYRQEAIGEAREHILPALVAVGDAVEILFHPCREGRIDQIRHPLPRPVGHGERQRRGLQCPPLSQRVTTIDYGLYSRRIGTRSSNSALLQRLHQRGLGETRRWLCLMAIDGAIWRRDCLAYLQVRQLLTPSILILILIPYAGNREPAREDHAGRACPCRAATGCIGNISCLAVVDGIRGLTGKETCADQAIQSAGILVDSGIHALTRGIGRPDTLVGALRPCLIRVVAWILGHEVGTPASHDRVARRGHRVGGNRDAIGTHIGDQAHAHTASGQPTSCVWVRS